MRPLLALSAAALLWTAGCAGGDGAAETPPATPTAGLEEEGAAAANAPDSAAPAPAKIDPSLIPEPGSPLVRETYAYSGGIRDPFASVLEGASIGPELADLDLVAIYYQDRNPSASVAVLRDRISMKRYSLIEGERVGRARVADVRPRDVSFMIDDYGTQRQVTLALKKPEDSAP